MMKVTSHPQELTKRSIEEWLEIFKSKLKRETSRNDLDRLILSVERIDFENEDSAGWTEVIFEDGKGKITFESERKIAQETWRWTSFQQKILVANPYLLNRAIKRSELKEEKGEWTLDSSLQDYLISAGGEAVVIWQKFGKLEVAVRVHVFDPALFTEKKEELLFKIHLSKDYDIAKNHETDDSNVIPVHQNVIKNFANIQIFSSEDKNDEDCLGWITIMEKCDSDLRSKLKAGDLNLEERKKIILELNNALNYLADVGIIHFDEKPENILLKNGEAKLIDFGIVRVLTDRKSYRQMGYALSGTKYKTEDYLYAGSPAFSGCPQLCGNQGGDASSSHVFLLCEWKTAWSLLFNPIEEGQRERIKEKLKKFNAEWLRNRIPDDEQIQGVTKVISLETATLDHCLDDPNLTKSCVMANLKQRISRFINKDFSNVTQNVVDQTDSELCVPLSISILLRWAIKNDLKMSDDMMAKYFSLESIFTTLTMVIYPRSIAGFNLNPKKEEQDFQENDVDMLLKRLKYETFLNESGWTIIKSLGYMAKMEDIEGSFDYKQVLLHQNFIFTRPLTVTGAYLNPNGSIDFHQMILDRVENDEYIIQNTLISHSYSQIRIPLDRRYYATYEMMEDCYSCFNDFVYYGSNNEFQTLANEQINNMEEKRWHLLPQAYEIFLAS